MKKTIFKVMYDMTVKKVSEETKKKDSIKTATNKVCDIYNQQAYYDSAAGKNYDVTVTQRALLTANFALSVILSPFVLTEISGKISPYTHQCSYVSSVGIKKYFMSPACINSSLYPYSYHTISCSLKMTVTDVCGEYSFRPIQTAENEEQRQKYCQ